MKVNRTLFFIIGAHSIENLAGTMSRLLRLIHKRQYGQFPFSTQEALVLTFFLEKDCFSFFTVKWSSSAVMSAVHITPVLAGTVKGDVCLCRSHRFQRRAQYQEVISQHWLSSSSAWQLAAEGCLRHNIWSVLLALQHVLSHLVITSIAMQVLSLLSCFNKE